MKNTFYACGLLLLTLFAGCKKDDDKKEITFDKLGDVQVTAVTGFAFNGDPLALNAAGQHLRWRASAKQWEKVGTGSKDIVLVAEDAGGTYYGRTSFGELFEMKAGASFQPLDFSDGDTLPPTSTAHGNVIINSAGDVAVSIRRQTPGGTFRNRVYRKAAGSTAWVQLNDRPEDELVLLQYTDKGEIFMQVDYSGSGKGYDLFSLKPGGGALTPVFDCNGTVIIPYCGIDGAVSPGGEIMRFSAGLGSRKIYRASASGSYPVWSKEEFSFPDDIPYAQSCFILGNGTLVAEGNDGGYEAERYYFRRPGASDWRKAPDFPGALAIYTTYDRSGKFYTYSQQLGFANSEGFVYEVKY